MARPLSTPRPGVVLARGFGMNTHDNAVRQSRAAGRGIIWIAVAVVALLMLLVLALVLRSAWWTEAGPPVPRGTSIPRTSLPVA